MIILIIMQIIKKAREEKQGIFSLSPIFPPLSKGNFDLFSRIKRNEILRAVELFEPGSEV